MIENQTITRKVRPQQGPQELFCSSPADIVIYGGAAGGGKSFALVLEAIRNVHVPGYGAVIFRRTYPQLTGAGSIWEESTKLYPCLGGVPREHKLEWRFPSNASVQFMHLQYKKDVFSHQSKQYAFIGYDELTQFEEEQFWYLVSRNRSTCGVRPYIRGATNPDPDSWVKRLISWWLDEGTGYPIVSRSGVLRWFVRDGENIVWGDSEQELRASFPDEDTHRVVSMTFIAAKLEDNPALTKADPGYITRLLVLPRVEREQLLRGNWNIRPAAGDFFQRYFFEIVDEPPRKVVARVRAWDKAATKVSTENPDPDWTAGVRMSLGADGDFYIEHVLRVREGPFGVDSIIKNTASQDGKAVVAAFWQDPGQAGKKDIAHTVKMLSGYSIEVERAAENKITYAKPLSSQAEAGNVKLVRGAWNDEFLDELEGFPTAKHDDFVDAASLAFMKLADSDLHFLRKMANK